MNDLVSIIIPSYNETMFTVNLVSTILNCTKYSPYEVLVIDDCSKRGRNNYEKMESREGCPVRIIHTPENRGFAGAVNYGVNRSNGGFLAIFNSDMLVSPDWLAPLMNDLQNNSKIGIVTPCQIGHDQHSAAHILFPHADRFGELVQALKNHTEHSITGWTWWKRNYKVFPWLISRKVWNDVGPMDEQFKVGGHEDWDYYRRLKAKGYKFRIDFRSFIYHYMGGTINKQYWEDELGGDNSFEITRRLYEKKWGPITVKSNQGYVKNYTDYGDFLEGD